MAKHLHAGPLRAEQAERVDQWREDSTRRSPEGRRLWRCWHCDVLAPWGPTWGYFGSCKEEDDGVTMPMFCSEECRTFLEIKGIVPRLTEAGAA